MSALSLAVFYAVAAPWLAARGAELHLLEGKAPARMLGLVVAGALTGLLGVGIGAAVRVQVAAVVGVLVWFLIAEPLVGYLIDSVGAYLPGAAGDALVQSDFAADNEKRLSVWGGLGVSAAYAAAALALGAYLTERRDVG